MNTSAYKKRVRRLLMLNALVAVAAFGLWFYFLFIYRSDMPDTGGPMGGLAGLCGVSVVAVVKYAKALKDEKKLKELMIQETDERKMAITQKATKITLDIIFILLLVAMFISSLLNQIVFYTILISAAVVVIIYGLVTVVVENRY